jgi:DNA-binding transcriptional LysR family regulator
MAYLPQVLNNFLKIHSDMSDFKFVFLQPAEALRGLRNEDFNLAVIEHNLDQDFTGFDRFILPDDEMLVVAAASLVIPNVDEMIPLNDLKNYRLFARRDGCSSKELLRRNLVACGCGFDDFEGVVVSDDLRFTLQSVLRGDGIAYLSRALVNSYLDSGELLSLRVEKFQHRRGRSVVMRSQHNQEALLKELLECIFEVASPFWRPQLVTGTAGER